MKMRISSFDGLKTVALMCVVINHAYSTMKPSISGVATGFFFVFSGFCLAYFRGLQSETEHLSVLDIARYIGRKLAMFYPIHLVSFGLAAYLTFSQNLPHATCVKRLYEAVPNLLLLHAWFNDLRFTYNGVSWFMSALLFCYMMAIPSLVLVKRNSRPLRLMFAIAGLLALRYGMERFVVTFPGGPLVNQHVFPLCRYVEFLTAMFVGAGARLIRDKLDELPREPVWRCIAFNSLDVLSVAVFALLMQGYSFGYRTLYLGATLLIAFCFSFDRGVLSWLMGLKAFRWFASIQLEFFMFHQLCIRFLKPRLTRGDALEYLLPATLVMTLGLCLTYRLVGCGVRRLWQCGSRRHEGNVQGGR